MLALITAWLHITERVAQGSAGSRDIGAQVHPGTVGGAPVIYPYISTSKQGLHFVLGSPLAMGPVAPQAEKHSIQLCDKAHSCRWVAHAESGYSR